MRPVLHRPDSPLRQFHIPKVLRYANWRLQAQHDSHDHQGLFKVEGEGESGECTGELGGIATAGSGDIGLPVEPGHADCRAPQCRRHLQNAPDCTVWRPSSRVNS